jgi:hypothetical protein
MGTLFPARVVTHTHLIWMFLFQSDQVPLECTVHILCRKVLLDREERSFSKHGLLAVQPCDAAARPRIFY